MMGDDGSSGQWLAARKTSRRATAATARFGQDYEPPRAERNRLNRFHLYPLVQMAGDAYATGTDRNIRDRKMMVATATGRQELAARNFSVR